MSWSFNSNLLLAMIGLSSDIKYLWRTKKVRKKGKSYLILSFPFYLHVNRFSTQTIFCYNNDAYCLKVATERDWAQKRLWRRRDSVGCKRVLRVSSMEVYGTIAHNLSRGCQSTYTYNASAMASTRVVKVKQIFLGNKVNS